MTGKYDPANDPFACSWCGDYLGELKRVSGHSLCDACIRDAGFDPAREEYR